MGQLAAIWSDHTEEVWGGTGARGEPLKAGVTLILQLRGCLRESFYLISFASLQRLVTNCPDLVLPCFYKHCWTCCLDKTHSCWQGLSYKHFTLHLQEALTFLLLRDHSCCSAGWGALPQDEEGRDSRRRVGRSCKHTPSPNPPQSLLTWGRHSSKQDGRGTLVVPRSSWNEKGRLKGHLQASRCTELPFSCLTPWNTARPNYSSQTFITNTTSTY